MKDFVFILVFLLVLMLIIVIPYFLCVLGALIITEVGSSFSDKFSTVNIFALGAVFYFLWVLLPTLYKNDK